MQINRQKRILFVDTNPGEIDLVLRAFTGVNAQDNVSVAHNAAEALDCMHSQGEYRAGPRGVPAVVLLGLNSVNLDELNILRAIKAELAFKEIPIVIFAPAYEPTLARESYLLGANSYIIKPDDFQHYLKLIRGLVAFWISLDERPRAGH